MASKNTKYAVDLSNDGVSLWHRGEDKTWNVLGKVALSSETFSDDVENLKTGYEPNIDGKFIAQVRIPRSEVFVSEIDLEGLTGAAATSKTKLFLSDKTPYQAQDLVFDLENNGAGKTSYVAAIAKQTIKEAKEFILGYGFEASFYTSKIDKTEFPRNPKFYDGKPPIVAPPLQSETVKETPQKTTVEEDVTPSAPPISTPSPPIKIKKKLADTEVVTTTTPKPPEPEPEIIPVPEVNKVEEKPLSATSTTDFSSFETIRSKSLIAPNKSGKKIEPTIATAPPLPPRRISIDLPKPVEKTATGAIKNPITMPQGSGINTNTGGFFKPKYALGIAALIVVALLYWFFTELFDGKEEIARLQETPQTEPTAILEPAVLKPINSNDAAPVITLDAVQEAHQIPNLEAPKLAAAPEPLTVAKGSVNDAGGEQLITEEQVAETLNEVANADTQQQEVATIEPDATTGEQSESVGETASPDLPTEVALVDLIPTKNGTPGAEGITLFAGQPDIIPPPREQLKISTDPLKNILPKMRSVEFEETHKTEAVIEPVEQAVAIAEDTTAPTDPVEDAVDTTEIEIAAPDILALADPTLKNKRPKLRPSTILQQAKEAQNSLLTKANPELAGLKPRIRPRNLSIPKEVVEPVIVQPAKIDPSEIEVAVQEAVRNIARPRARPRSLSKIAARAKASAKANSNDTRTAALTPSTATGTSKPSAATPTGVQKEATEKAGFSKRRISLIGVYGTASSRRALVRLPSGRFVKVKAGQRVSGWKVSAIGESSVRISKGSRNQVLRMPK